MKNSKSESEQSERIPLLNKIGYACGAMTDNLIMNAFGALVLPVYNLALFIDPALQPGALQPGALQLTWNGRQARSCQIESSTNLFGFMWNTVTNIGPVADDSVQNYSLDPTPPRNIFGCR